MSGFTEMMDYFTKYLLTHINIYGGLRGRHPHILLCLEVCSLTNRKSYHVTGCLFLVTGFQLPGSSFSENPYLVTWNLKQPLQIHTTVCMLLFRL